MDTGPGLLGLPTTPPRSATRLRLVPGAAIGRDEARARAAAMAAATASPSEEYTWVQEQRREHMHRGAGGGERGVERGEIGRAHV